MSSIGPQSYPSKGEERLHRKQRLAASYRLFARFGFDEGVAGHITARDPEHADRFWVNPLGLSWRLIRARDLCQVDFDGRVLVGERPVNGAAFAIHSEIHRAREDVVAAAHAHTPYGRAWSATGRPLEPISQDHCAFYGDHAVFSDFTGAVYDSAESRRFATALGAKKALILQNHGLLTVGQTVDEAAFWLHLLERCAQTMLLVGALAPVGGRTAYTALSHEVASYTHEQVGQPLHGWRGFQPLWDEMIAEQEDMLS
jgi:ribulose-5-phosphate 4-epimerase/fuculose-1-phosphate aldolase